MMPPTIRGVINLRGAVVPVIDLSARFGRGPSAVARRTCIVIIEVRMEEMSQTLGVMVDAVNEVRKPLMAEYGHHATGLYEVTSNQHEVVMVWATDIPSQVRLHQSRDAVLASLLNRDRIDSSRELAPLRVADGAYTIDTTNLPIDDVVAAILARLPPDWLPPSR